MKPSDASIESAKKWASEDPNPTTAEHVKVLLNHYTKRDDKTAAQQLSSWFPSDDTRISFGTAGLRAGMHPGPLAMNDLTIVQTAQGLAKYCLKQQKKRKNDESEKKLQVVVGYDHRYNPTMEVSSLSFAIITSLVMAEAGIDCILLDGFVLTPLVPFVVKTVGAAAGVMITASHNPRHDNGYKVYASDSCQIRAPMDKDIAAEILENLSPWTNYGEKIKKLKKETDDSCLGLSCPDTTKEMLGKYYKSLEESGLKTGQAKIERLPDSIDPPSFAYTAMHGIGHKYAVKVFEVFGLPAFKAVPEQRDPDFTFPTVDFPNPEEKGAMDLAKKFADDNKCDIVLANDPDADRLAVAERDRSTGEWSVFTGDQIGSMLGLWIWEKIGKDCGKPVSMCGSTVSSKMLAEIARVEGFHFEDTLTGFKWIGSRATELQSSGYRNLFGYEEAIGFACGDVIFDKDGISAMAVFSEMVLWVYNNGKTLSQHMQSMYDKYGEFVSYNGYYFMMDPSVVPKIMERIRCDGKYDLDLSPYKVDYIRDLGEPGYDNSKEDKKPTLPTSKSSPMMTLGFTNGCVAQFRASGTEPKFKYYIEMKGKPGVARDVVEKELNEMADFLLETLLEPTKHNLKSK